MTGIELSRRERKKEETKERIFHAALKLFKQKGFEATTVDDVAEKADVAKGTFFNYFPRKESVFGYLSEGWLNDAEEKLEGIVADGRPAGQRVRDIFVELAAFYEDDRELARWVVRDWQYREQSGCDGLCERWDRLGQDVVRHLQRLGEIRSDVPAEAAADVLASVHQGTVMRWLSAPEPPFPLREELRRRLDLVVEGLGSGEDDQ